MFVCVCTEARGECQPPYFITLYITIHLILMSQTLVAESGAELVASKSQQLSCLHSRQCWGYEYKQLYLVLFRFWGTKLRSSNVLQHQVLSPAPNPSF